MNSSIKIIALLAIVSLLTHFSLVAFKSFESKQDLFEQLSASGANIVLHDLGVYVCFGPLVPPYPESGYQATIRAGATSSDPSLELLLKLEQVTNLRYVDFIGVPLTDLEKQQIENRLGKRCRIHFDPPYVD